MWFGHRVGRGFFLRKPPAGSLIVILQFGRIFESSEEFLKLLDKTIYGNFDPRSMVMVRAEGKMQRGQLTSSVPIKVPDGRKVSGTVTFSLSSVFAFA